MTGTAGTNSPFPGGFAVTHADFTASRPAGAEEDVHMVPTVVDQVIKRLSQPGDMVLDPFAGFGTTLGRALALGRRAVGVELLPERVDHIREHIPDAGIVEGDARELREVLSGALPALGRGGVDLIVSSPPYMTETHHDADPLTAYEENTGNYPRYLAELGLVAAQCADLLKRGGFIVWNVADIHHMGHTTHLVDDCARVLAQYFSPIGATPISWDRLPHDLVADALLVFRRL
ncbi:TRM11 family SAM-dependent methyltransferase [Tessaracoccus massiliensis]|uniref:TRM11 family SAM-dependent methyltransferase n=1 Tax=Tessaracoccus massiliensis TaxID=1522311 RepID=UPI00058B96F2|nr:DNA methyltransferase [Tessaracoccus massiliensis]